MSLRGFQLSHTAACLIRKSLIPNQLRQEYQDLMRNLLTIHPDLSWWVDEQGSGDRYLDETRARWLLDDYDENWDTRRVLEGYLESQQKRWEPHQYEVDQNIFTLYHEED